MYQDALNQSGYVAPTTSNLLFNEQIKSSEGAKTQRWRRTSTFQPFLTDLIYPIQGHVSIQSNASSGS